MTDRYTLSISGILMVFIAALMGIHLTQSSAQAESEPAAGQNDAYKVLLTTQPSRVVAGETFQLALDIADVNGEVPVSAFDIVHEKPLHLILISEDLQEFLHVHPDYSSDGAFVLNDALLPAEANYVVFADFTPTGDEQQAVRLVLPTEGAETIAPELTAGETEFSSGPLHFTLDVPETLASGGEVSIRFQVTDAETGEPVDTLDEYLGAAGHLVIVDQAAQTYLHTHPAEGEHEGGHDMAGMETSYGPDVEFISEFPAAGTYAMWLQVQYQGEIYTAPFVVEVAEGEAAEGESGGHSSGGHGG